jgi:tRNA(fMet)-specific endonuclease VapC
MKYLLDTNTVSFAIRGIGNVGNSILKHTPSDLLVSSITEAELWNGVKKRKSKNLEKLVSDFLNQIQVIDLKSADAQIYGKLFLDLEQKGKPIGMAYSMIASIAMSNGLVLVTDNLKHFNRIKGLKLENWL